MAVNIRDQVGANSVVVQIRKASTAPVYRGLATCIVETQVTYMMAYAPHEKDTDAIQYAVEEIIEDTLMAAYWRQYG